MSAYIVVDIDIRDPEAYKEYIRLAPASIRQYGGRYIARGGRTEVFEGKWTPKRLVILEFDTLDRAREWLDSPEYAPARAIRQAAAGADMVAIEGIAVQP
ncbi:MAG TPA: DUF1330 domain-containing protein [Candidatus Eisenbacteria bacterium]